MMDKANSGVFKNCNNHIREKLVELFDEAARICNNKRCNRCSYLDVPSCVDELAIDHLIANGVTVQEWIPVSERLPEKNTANIVADQYGIVFQCLYAYDGWDLWEENEVVITHWMPLPQPPKGE